MDRFVFIFATFDSVIYYFSSTFHISHFTFHIFFTLTGLRGRGISPWGRGQLQERLRYGPHQALVRAARFRLDARNMKLYVCMCARVVGSSDGVRDF